MPDENGNGSSDSWLSRKIKVITGVVVALTALIVALIHFWDSIPWFTPVSKIDIAPAELTLAVGDRIQLAATAKDKQGDTLSKRVTWSSANPALVTVSSDGIVVGGDTTGETTVAATVGSVRGVVPVHVRRVSVAKVQIFPDSKTIQVGEHLAFDATPYDDQQNFLAGRPVRWSSENNDIVEIDPANQSSTQAVGKRPGSAKITAASEEQMSTAFVTVAPAQAPSPQPSVGSNTPVDNTQAVTAPPPPPPPFPHKAASKGHRSPASLPVETAAPAPAASEITIVGGTKMGQCPATLRILIGNALIDLKSDPQGAASVPFGDQTYSLHGTISCPGQTMFVADGQGSVTIAQGKTYRCVWTRQGAKNFLVTLAAQ